MRRAEGGRREVGCRARQARDVVVLGRAHGRVDEDHAVLADVLGVEGAGEELVVGAVDCGGGARREG